MLNDCFFVVNFVDDFNIPDTNQISLEVRDTGTFNVGNGGHLRQENSILAK